mgnify:CR=1 FL=1
MIKEAIAQLVKREDLTSEVMEQVMEEIMTGEATDAQKASFLTALSMKLTRLHQQLRYYVHTASVSLMIWMCLRS